MTKNSSLILDLKIFHTLVELSDLKLNLRKYIYTAIVKRKKLFHLSILAFRWIKFEEDVEEGGNRWSKPHVATLSLHSLFELRSMLLNGTICLDMAANTLGTHL